MINSESQYNAMRLAINIGKKIQKIAPEIAELYRQGASRESIVSYLTNYHLESEGVGSRDVLVNAIKFALVGNTSKRAASSYSGLLTYEEYAQIASAKRKAALARGNEKMVREKRGLHSLTKIELANNTRLMLEKRGISMWTDEELGLALLLGKDSKMTYAEIATTLNQTYHAGKGVRTSSSIYNTLSRLRKNSRDFSQGSFTFSDVENFVAEWDHISSLIARSSPTTPNYAAAPADLQSRLYHSDCLPVAIEVPDQPRSEMQS